MAQMCCGPFPSRATKSYLNDPQPTADFIAVFPRPKYVGPFLAQLYDRMVEFSCGNHFGETERLTYPALSLGVWRGGS